MSQEYPEFMEIVELDDTDPIAGITGGVSPWLLTQYPSADNVEAGLLTRILGSSLTRRW